MYKLINTSIYILMINLKEYSILVKTSLLILVLFSFFYSFITGEDSLGGAEHDYIQNNIFFCTTLLY